MRAWQYKAITFEWKAISRNTGDWCTTIDGREVQGTENALNTLGAQGWEVVSMVTGQQNGKWSQAFAGGDLSLWVQSATVWFKRPVE